MGDIKYGNKAMLHFLSRIDELGPVSISKIYESFDMLAELLSIDVIKYKDEIGINYKTALAIEKKKYDYDAIYEEYLALRTKGISFICMEDEYFPKRLLDIPQRALYLYVKGKFKFDEKPAVSIVGSRLCSNYGAAVAKEAASAFAKRGIVVVSGMAMGIDKLAHIGALSSANKSTVAVLACGVDICYPKENINLYSRILEEEGAIISEFAPGKIATKWNFPLRNRIISGLGDVLLVVEAKEKSGTFITVDHALEQGREVFAVPGRIFDPLSKGCNHLIASGASIFTSIEDIISALDIKIDKRLNYEAKDISILSEEESRVYNIINLIPMGLDEILEKSKMDLGVLMSILLRLELAGYIKQVLSNSYVRAL